MNNNNNAKGDTSSTATVQTEAARLLFIISEKAITGRKVYGRQRIPSNKTMKLIVLAKEIFRERVWRNQSPTILTYFIALSWLLIMSFIYKREENL